MRTLILAAAAILPLALGACANDRHMRTSHNSSEREIDRLERQCKAQGGVLVPSGRLTGREPLDNICKIHGGGSMINPPPGAR